MPDFRGILGELWRRRVIPVVVYYVGIAWIILQFGDVAQETWDFSPVILRYVWIILGIGLPITIVLSWIYDITPQGVVETTRTEKSRRFAQSFAHGRTTFTADIPADRGDIACPTCQTFNKKDSKFCIQCGAAFELSCPNCGAAQDTSVKFCSVCGKATADGLNSYDSQTASTPAISTKFKTLVCVVCAKVQYDCADQITREEEAGEEIADFLDRVAGIMEKQGGFIESCHEGTVTALFGISRSREYDSVSALIAALAMRDLATGSATHDAPTKVIKMGGIGVSSGFVMARKNESGNQVVGAIGNTFRDAAKLSEIAGCNEILVSSSIIDQTRNFFDFGPELDSSVSEDVGLSDPIRPLVGMKEEVSTVRRSTGRSAPLIGRSNELAQLNEGLRGLERGRGSIFSITGAAGSGKSRLVEEFKARQLPGRVNFIEGHAFSHTKNTPYFPVCDLLKTLWKIKDSDDQATLRNKVVEGASALIGEGSNMIPYIAGLFGLADDKDYRDDPEVWNMRAKRSLLALVSALSMRQPTVFLIEDLHWADSASLELVRFIISELRSPAVLICTYRSHFQLIEDWQREPLGKAYVHIQLNELSASEAAEMTEQLCGGKTIPGEFRSFVANEAKGNPFYLEEVVNTAVESGILSLVEERWELTGPLEKFKVPSTVVGVITERIGRLKPAERAILEKASVIGRAFSFQLLNRVTQDSAQAKHSLKTLEELGLIQTRTGALETAYVFKHVLTQEVIYNGLLHSRRRELHERIGIALEDLFSDRLMEVCEMLAFHFMNGISKYKAISYLFNSAKKSWHRYSLTEASGYYEQIYELLKQDTNIQSEADIMLLNLIDQWAIVFNHKGDYRGLRTLLDAHEGLASSMAEQHPQLAAMFFGWKGYVLQCSEDLVGSYNTLSQALKYAEASGSDCAVAYIRAWLARTCTDMGKLGEAVDNGRIAWQLAERMEPDSKLFRFIWSALGLAHYFRGDRKSVEEAANLLKDYANINADRRALLLSQMNQGFSSLIAGEYDRAVTDFERATTVAVDPMYGMYAQLMLGVALASTGRLNDAEQLLVNVVEFDRTYGFNTLGTTARGMTSVALLARGELGKGVAMAEDVIASYREHGNWFRFAHQHLMLGNFYLKLVLKEGPTNFGLMAKNLTFMVKNIMHVREKAQSHLHTAMETAQEIGAKGVLGQSWYDLGRLNSALGETAVAREMFLKADEVFEDCNATGFKLRLANALESLELFKKTASM
jgi:tetratricopeptide (TPR) repeat protein/class 3 adenylate cyclase